MGRPLNTLGEACRAWTWDARIPYANDVPFENKLHYKMSGTSVRSPSAT